ncbi:hypothetical protein CVT25_006948 [Psilocybe cyanescens]|uniref:Protein kinase domain-containing protein n=1 Tax=Psilocybe cyanescens TaxID=93625 RepID=A0A409VSJ0_PSICY|nr:hypothetical protein CVT25_006948 [Psilocybe cyanescens]
MTMCPLYEQDEWDDVRPQHHLSTTPSLITAEFARLILQGRSNSLAAPSIAIVQCEKTPSSPRLEVANIDSVPFSQKFSDLFNSLGLHIPPSAAEGKNRISRNLDISYDIENYTNIKDIDPEWKHDDIDEIVVMSPKSTFNLSTIHEDTSLIQVPSACLADFDIEESDIRWGAGRSFRANMCTRRDNGQKYIIKRKQTRNDSSWSEKVVLETLAGLSLPFISTIRWTFRNEEHVYIVSDHHPAGSLLDLVNQHGPLGSPKAIFYASELVSAISSLHNAGIMHKDLEPRNIALDADGHIVITNFSRAESLPVVRAQGISSMTGFGDTMSEFRAPEIFLGWSLDSAHPYGMREGIDDPRWLYDRIVVFSVPTESLRLIHPMARDLIAKCLQRNPSLRWTMEKIKSHGYFALVDWDQVAAKQVDAPSFRRTAMEVDRVVFQSDSQRRHVSLNASFPDNDCQSRSDPLRLHSLTTTNTRNRTVPEISNASDIFRPLSISMIPEAIQEEDEPVSLSASTGHIGSERDEYSIRGELAPTERMSELWAELDKEEQLSTASVITQEFGASNSIPHTKVPKLRKYRSAIHSHRLFSLNTSSFHKKLRQKPRSTATLRQARQAEPIDNLPNGLHQMGSGIGFTYNIPTGAPSKVSVRSFAPSCNHLFHGGFPALNLGLGLGHSPRLRVKDRQDHSPASHDPPAAHDHGHSHSPQQEQQPRPREVGNGTFIRDMYRTPSWIFSPPDSLPSPMALVNPDPSHHSSSSPLAASSDSSGPFTPATLVDDDSDCDEGEGDYPREVNITIPKNLELDLDLDFRMWAPNSTLRLVVPSPVAAADKRTVRRAPELRMSYEDDGDDDGDGDGVREDSLYTEVTSTTSRG